MKAEKRIRSASFITSRLHYFLDLIMENLKKSTIICQFHQPKCQEKVGDQVQLEASMVISKLEWHFRLQNDMTRRGESTTGLVDFEWWHSHI